MGILSSIFGGGLHSEVLDYLGKVRLKTSELTSEKNIENILVTRLKKQFDDITQQFNVEGYIGLKVDIDIQEEVGIELKLAKDLKTAASIHRLFGQSIYYNKRKYDGNLIVAVVGTKDELDSPMFREMEEFLTEQNISVIFIQTIGK